MYKKERTVQLISSASMLTNNVSSLCNASKGTVSIAVVHKAVVHVITSAMDGSSHTQNQYASKESSNNSMVIILQAKLVQMNNRVILVLCTQRGIQMFDSDGATMIYWHALEDSRDKSEASCHARGVCAVGSSTICVGTYQGHILILNVPAKGTNVTQQDLLKGHGSSVSALCEGGSTEFVSSDDSGDIIVWRGPKYKSALHIPNYGYPCSCLAVWKGLIVGGYGSGHIRLFSITSGHLTAEVTAHARWVTGLDVAANGLLISTSDDTFVRVWQIRDGNQPAIEHKQSECVPNLQLVGGAFTSPDGRGFCVAGYDSNELSFYRSS